MTYVCGDISMCREFVLRKAFTQLDKDKSGKISKKEIVDAINKSDGISISREHLNSLLDNAEQITT